MKFYQRKSRTELKAKLQRPFRNRLRFEALEDRSLLAVDFELLKDIMTDPSPLGSEPTLTLQVGGTTFFTATSASQGMELWKTNGTAAGTVLVKDIVAGDGSSYPSDLTNVNGTLFFKAVGQIWKSDGTTNGTVQVTNFNTALFGGTFVSSLHNFNGILTFVALNDEHGEELWKSNGTAAGTMLLKDIRLGTGSSRPRALTTIGGTLFFIANDGTSGYELWKSNGTSAGTVIVKDIQTGSSSSSPSYLSNVNGTLFFTANDGTNGRELWKSNGISSGTVLVKDIRPGTSDSNASQLVNLNGTLFFVANDGTNGTELWKSNGAEAGTTLVKDINDGSSGSSPRYLTNVNGTLFFSAFGDDGTIQGFTGRELWKSNGAAAGTVLVKDIAPGSGFGNDSNPVSLANVNGTLFFVTTGAGLLDGTRPATIWKSNGTQLGTIAVKNFIVDFEESSGPRNRPDQLVNNNGTLLFVVNDRIRGHELWKSNGTDAGTVLVKDILGANGNSAPPPFSATAPVNINGTLYFVATNGAAGEELWKTNGTTAGTVLVKDIFPGVEGSSPRDLINVNGTLYFTANDGTHGRELWKSNGTAAGTVLVTDILPDINNGAEPRFLTNVNGTVFFSAVGPVGSRELWKSNGVPTGTVLVKDIRESIGLSSNPEALINFNGTLFFRANDGTNGRELWKSNGTTAGTVLVKDILPGTSEGFPNDLTNVNGTLFFIAAGGLWKSDGSSTGTTLVKNQGGDRLTNVNGTLFFRTTQNFSSVLFKSNGTEAGTVLVSSKAPTGSIKDIANANGTLFYTARTGDNGYELWKSNGTELGTVLVKDIAPGNRSSYPKNLTVIGNTLFFQADDGVLGKELWQSNGTAVGTVLTADIATGPGSSSPSTIVELNGKLLVLATTETHGQEFFVGTIGSGGGGTAALAIAATSANKNEGQSGTTPFTFSVTRTGSLTGATTVNYAVTGIGANPSTANDFVGNVLPSGTVTFAAGQAARVITIPVRGDASVEPNETFRVTLSSATGGATITTPAANGVIRNDDTSLAIAATSANKNEADSGSVPFTFTVMRTGVLTGITTVNYAVTGVGANPAATSDFVGNAFPSGTVTFAGGQATRVITIPVRGDAIAEVNETFRVTLSTPSTGTTITTPAANGLIRNDDTALAIAATSANKNEGNLGATPFTFTITRTGVLTGMTQVNYAVTGNGANPAAANDFVGNALPSGQVTFAAGETTKVITINVRGDLVAELDERFIVTLSNATGATISTVLAAGLIRNDDV